MLGIYFWQINTFLLNPLNRCHPFFLYWGIITSTFFTLRRLPSISFGNPWLLNQISSFTKIRIIKNIYVILIALFLGSWWAFQEGTWGGWWNWDPSEVFGLLFLMLQLTNLHENTNYLKLVKVSKKMLVNLSTLLGVYFFIQLNFEIISHNFGIKFFFFFNNNLFFLLSLLNLLTLVGWYFLQDATYVKLFILLTRLDIPNILEKNIVTSVGLGLSLVFLLIPLLVSFVPTIQYFFYTYFGLNLFNFEVYLGPIVISLSLLWLVIFTQLNFLGPFSLATTTLLFGVPYTTILLSLRSYYYPLVQLHLLLALFLAITLLLYTYSTSYPLFTPTPTLTIVETTLNLTPPNYSLNIDLVEVIVVSKANPTQSTLSTWQLIYDSNNVKLNAYLLPISNLSLSNYYVLQSLNPSLIYLTETGTTQSLIFPIVIVIFIPYLYFYNLRTKT